MCSEPPWAAPTVPLRRSCPGESLPARRSHWQSRLRGLAATNERRRVLLLANWRVRSHSDAGDFPKACDSSLSGGPFAESRSAQFVKSRTTRRPRLAAAGSGGGFVVYVPDQQRSLRTARGHVNGLEELAPVRRKFVAAAHLVSARILF